MSESTINSLISAGSGLLGVLIGSFLSYLFQVRLDKKRREHEKRDAIRKQLLEGTKEFAEKMRENGKQLVSWGDSDTILQTVRSIRIIVGFIWGLIIMLLISVSDFRVILDLSKPSTLQVVFLVFVGISVGLFLVPTFFEKKN